MNFLLSSLQISIKYFFVLDDLYLYIQHHPSKIYLMLKIRSVFQNNYCGFGTAFYSNVSDHLMFSHLMANACRIVNLFHLNPTHLTISKLLEYAEGHLGERSKTRLSGRVLSQKRLLHQSQPMVMLEEFYMLI